MVVDDIDADEFAEDDEQHRALQQGPDERPEEPEEGVLVRSFSSRNVSR